MSDTYEGWANRETWALWLRVTNDQGWYESVRDYARDAIANHRDSEPIQDHYLGERVVDYVRDALNELTQTEGVPSDAMIEMRDAIGSWWRIDYAEIGAAARELASDS